MEFNPENKEDIKTVTERVTLVDDRSDEEINLENTTVFKEGKIVDYDSKIVDPEEDLGTVECYSDHEISDTDEASSEDEVNYCWEYKGYTLNLDKIDPNKEYIEAENSDISLRLMSTEDYFAISEDDREDVLVDQFQIKVDEFLESLEDYNDEDDEDLEEDDEDLDFGDEEEDVEEEDHWDYPEFEAEEKEAMEEYESTPEITSAAVKVVPTMEEALSDLGETFTEEDDVEITPEDIKSSLKDSMFNEGNKEFTLPDEDILVILDIVNKVKNKENVNIFSSFPQSVKDMINSYMLEQGVSGYSNRANEIRNMLSDTLIDEFISNISINKTVESFNKEMEDLFVKTGEEFSKMYKEYDTERTKYLEAALEKIPEGDPKRETITNVLDSINDAYKLNRLKEATPKLKIKNFDREKPERVFSDFEFKYKGTDYHVYPIKTVAATLNKHLQEAIIPTLPEDLSDDDKKVRAEVLSSIETMDFLILFCKFCMNYRPSVPEEHAFMYYTLYNIMLLDVYKGEEYKEFAEGFINNIIEAYKPYYKKIMSEKNFKKRFG